MRTNEPAKYKPGCAGDDETPKMQETNHSGRTNGGLFHTKADFGQTIIQSRPLDRSAMYGQKEDEVELKMAGGFDNIAHSIVGAKVAPAAVRGPDAGGTKSTIFAPGKDR